MNKTLAISIDLETPGTFPVLDFNYGSKITLTGDLGTSEAAGSAEKTAVTLGPSDTLVIFDTGAGTPTSGIVYFYISAVKDNLDLLRVEVDSATGFSGSGKLQLAPGDFTFFPMKVNKTGQQVTLINLSATEDCSVLYFWAIK